MIEELVKIAEIPNYEKTVRDETRLIATLPLEADGKSLKKVRCDLHITQERFAELLRISRLWLHRFEKGGTPLFKCQRRTLLLIACGLIQLKVRLKADGWEYLDKPLPLDRFAGEIW